MTYYWYNRNEILQKVKERYSKEKSAEYFSKHNNAIKEKSRDWYKNLPVEEKDKIKDYHRQRYQQPIHYEKGELQDKWVLFLLSIRMSEKKTLKFDNTRVNKKNSKI